jgi:hypothetical protein
VPYRLRAEFLSKVVFICFFFPSFCLGVGGKFLFSRPDYGRWFWALAIDEGKAFAAHPVAV